MSSSLLAAEYLSFAGHTDCEAIVGAIVDANAETIVGTATAQIDRLSPWAPGLREVILELIREHGAWTPAFGGFEAALRRGEARQLLTAAAQLALACHDVGIPGEWSTEFHAPTRLRVGDVAIIEAVSLKVAADSSGYVASACTIYGDRCRYEVRLGAAPCPDLVPIELWGRHVRLSSSTDIGTLPGIEFLEQDQWNVSADLPRVRSELASAETWVGRFSPRYSEWISSVLRQILFTAPGPGLMESGSSRILPGFVHVAHGEAAALAEMLVHELSHQYYYLATRLGPIDDGTDSTLYWSPVKQTGRPIANILLAYHAFGNVLLIMRDRLAADGGEEDRSVIEYNAADIIDQLRQLQAGLEATNALTDVGLGLYLPLRDELGLLRA